MPQERCELKVAVVTDSTSDIPAELAVEYGIHIVPAILVVGGQSLEDGRGMSREELYRQLPTMATAPTTAAPSSGSFEKLYETVLSSGADHIISIHVSGTLSGICNAASAAARAFDHRVQVIDSCHVTLGLGFQVLAAARAAASGLPLNEIQNAVESIRRRTHLVAMLDTLEYVRRSGRVSWAKSSLSSLFQIKPFIGIDDGKVIRMGEARTRKKGVDRLFQMLSDLGPLEHLAILHTNAEADALQFMDRSRPLVKELPLIVNVTTVIGVHVGPNGLGFVVITA